MNNSINPLSVGLIPTTSDTGVVWTLSDLPAQFMDMIKGGALAKLEILPGKNLLHLNGETFEVNLPDNFLSASLSKDQIISLKIKSNGQIVPLKSQLPNETEQALITPQGRTYPPIDLPPLKLQDMIIGKLKELHIPERVIKQVSQDIAPLNVSLSSIGQTVDNNDLLNSLQKWFDNIANIRADQPAISAKEQLQNIVASFIGRQIGGEVAGRTNNLTFINTPLGNTFFPSEIKLPLAEQVVLTITSQTSTLRQELAFLDNVIALLHQDHNSALKPEMVATYPQLKNLAVLNEVDPPLLAEIVKKLPFTGEHLLENIYDLYQAIKETDVSKWLSAKTLRLDHHGAEAKTLITEELNSFISSALKETPSWRVVEMPLFDGNSFKPLKIALKKEQNEPQNQSQGLQDITRFIVETEFSKLGGFQFDGLTDKPKRHFDLIIRTSQNMKKDFCTDIINLFKKSIYNLGYAGSIKINQKEAFISFLPENTIKQGIYV